MTDDFIKSDVLKAGAPIEPQPLKIGYGLALTIQQKQLRAALYELKTGQLLAETEAPNALLSFGKDAASLIAYAENDRKALQLTSVLREQVFDLILELLKNALEKTEEKKKPEQLEQTEKAAESGEAEQGAQPGGQQLPLSRGFSPQDIHYVAVAGTTLMQHLFAAMNPSGLGENPPRPVSLFGEEILAEPTMYFCPCISASIGGDVTAAMLTEALQKLPSAQQLFETGETKAEAVLMGAGMALTETGRQRLKAIAKMK